MKKVLTLCTASVFVLMCALPTQAQSIKWGFVAGLDLSKVSLSGNYSELYGKNFSTSNKAGWYVGPKIKVTSGLGIGFDAALQYSQRDLDIEGEKEKYRTIEIPINLRFDYGVGRLASVYISTGPQFGFALNRMKWNDWGDNYEKTFKRSNMNTTWNIGVGVTLLSHLEVGVGYNFGIGRTGRTLFEGAGLPVGTDSDYRLKYKANTFQAQLTYWF